MKLRYTQKLSSSSRKRPKKGFALIATLTLMMLLAMLAVAIMALAASQNRIALQTMLQAEARQQALVGLDAAIGELQVELGPDQRVSASSGIINESEGSTAQHLLGVWDSWDGPIYGRSVSGKGSKISGTYSRGRSDMFRRWLISSRDVNTTRSMNAANQLCDRDPGRRICLVGEGTLGKSLSAQHYVYADLLSMPATGKNEACFAWWIGGENQKAKISVQNRKETNDPYEMLHRTWDTPAPRFVDNRDLDFIPGDIEEPARLVTLASLPLVGSSSQAAGMPYFFDVTTTSYTLPINVSMGGFKQDLCLLLNKKSLKDTEFAARRNQDCPLVENQDVPKGTEQDMPIGSWQNLHAYYNCWPNGEAKDNKNFTARLLGNLQDTYTRMSGSAFDGNMKYGDDPDSFAGDTGEGGAFSYDTRTLFEEGSETSGYARTPVMLAFVSNFGLVTEENPKGLKTSDGVPVYDLSVCFAPMFLWWNPYNVPMKIRGRQLWSHSLPYKAAWLQTLGYPQNRPVKNERDYEWGQRGLKELGSDNGQFFQASENDKTGDIVFQPGEIIFFSPAKARINNPTDPDEYQNPWSPGYHPSAVAGFKAKVYCHEDERTTPQHKSTELGMASESNINAGHFRLSMRFGKNSEGGQQNTDGYWFAPARREAITLFNGYNGMGAKNNAVGHHGKKGQSPQRGILGWYNPDNSEQNTVFCDSNKDDAVWSLSAGQDDPDQPYYVAAVGIVAKSANAQLDKHLFPNVDFRSKIWQHSSPAFWGSALIDPDDQMRKYHPYQLACLPVSSGMDSAPMDNIGRNGFLGITSEGEQVSFASVLELPVHPPFSLAGLAGMRLQPGWYQADSNGNYARQGALRRAQYQAGVPSVGIGNAFADPCLPADDVYTYYQNNLEVSELKTNARIFSDFFDHGLLINDAMWDRWFCSSVSDMPEKDGKTTEAREVLTKFLKGEEELPVSRYKRVNTPYNDEQIIKRIMSGDGWKHIAQYIMIDGGFNVNSISVDAWAATLQGLAKRKLVSMKDREIRQVEEGKTDNQVLFSRFMLSTTDTSVDSQGGYSMMQGSTNFRNSGMASAWGEVRMLEAESIRKLAEEMVKQVRKRGPFLSLSDFVNRRLQEGELGLKGALQAAIDATDINRDFDEVRVPEARGQMFKNPQAGMGSLHTAAPGYLIQSDVLASLGNILTVRDDTFTIRAYGCVRNPNKAILAQAWCEAVVQRTMDYVDPSNNPQDSEYNPDGTKGEGLSNTNKVMGRQFRIVSFKWLDNWDI